MNNFEKAQKAVNQIESKQRKMLLEDRRAVRLGPWAFGISVLSVAISLSAWVFSRVPQETSDTDVLRISELHNTPPKPSSPALLLGTNISPISPSTNSQAATTP